MTPPRLIATDLDGTLIRDDHSLSARTADALEVVRAAGIGIVAVTARPPRVFEELSALPHLLDAAICVNGAMVVATGTGGVLRASAIPVPSARKTAAELRAAIPDITFGVETGREVVAEAVYRRVDRVADRRVILPTLDEVFARADPILKLLAHCPGRHADTLLTVARGIDAPGVEFSHSGGRGLLEISAAGVTKAEALAWYCRSIGVSAADVVAFGDMPNDVPMLVWAGTSYAMGGAHPEAVAAATGRTTGNEDHGVARVLERLLAP
ncbi:HAD family hydrolase [Stackebrandtia albiflava]|nr:HAD family hydrolase [Stackebrandtia albiflava]